MKVAAMFGDGTAGLADKPEPHARGEFAVVRVCAAPMCTEYKGFGDGNRSDSLGHEAAGEVVEVAQTGAVSVGDRVVVMPQYPCGKCPLCLQGEYIHCQHLVDVHDEIGAQSGTATYAQFLLKQNWLLIPIPDGVSMEHGAMACCGVGPTFGAMERMHVTAFHTLLITGLGPVGLGGVINGVQRGARVIAVESHPYRAALAQQLGAAAVVDSGAGALEQIMDLTGGIGVDRAVDCSGVAAAQRLMIDALRRRGQGAFVGEGGELSIRVSQDMIRKGISLHGSWHYNLADTPRIMEMVGKLTAQLDLLITHRFAMSRVQEAWELQMTGECGKVVLDPWS